MFDFKKKIYCGMSPIDALNEIIEKDPGIKNFDLSLYFANEFPNVSGEAIQAIWYWERPGKRKGINSDGLNEILIYYLKEAGYII